MLVNTRGEAAIIGTVLLILAVVVSGGIVAYYAIQQTQSVDASCLEVLNGIEFVDVGYTCRMLDAPEGALTSFSIKISDDRIDGFQVGLEQGGATQTYEVKEGRSYNELCLIGNNFAESLSAPASGDTRTYVARGDVQKMFIAPILKNGKGCYAEARKEASISNECVNPAVEGEMIACLASSDLCGNEVIDVGEECDPPEQPCVPSGYGSSCVYCDASCSNRTVLGPHCGDGICQANENYTTCSSDCGPAPFCGDGDINQPHELCDGSDLGNLTCSALNFTGGTLSCTANCTLNTTQCTSQFCGNNITEGTEQCDGSDLSNRTCLDSGYIGGTLGCTSCMFNFSQCIAAPSCGNGVREGLEQCDDGNSNNNDACTNACENAICSDSIIFNQGGGTEECDDGDLESCDGCNYPQCRFDDICGDGIAECGEECDDGNSWNGDGCSANCLIETAQCGNGVVEAGELCDPPGSACGAIGNPDDSDGAGGGVTGEAIGEGGVEGSDAGGEGICSLDCRACEPAEGASLNQPSWSTGSSVEGAPVSLLVSGTNVGTLPLEIHLYEDDPVFDDLLQSVTTVFDSAGSPVITTFPAPWQCDILFGILCDWFEGVESEIYAIVSIQGQPGTEVIGTAILRTTQGNPLCGNGLVQSSEACDPAYSLGCDPDGPLGPIRPGYGESCFECSEACTLYSVDGPYCGDSFIDSAFGELCDGNSEACTTAQGYLGTRPCLSCTSFGTCTSDLFCGDGVRNGPEACDGSDLNGQSCISLGFTGGTLGCLAGCGGFDTSQCTTGNPVCGNGIVEQGEDCDPPGTTGGACEITGDSTGDGSVITGDATGSGSGLGSTTAGTQVCSSTCTWECTVNP